MLCRERRQRLFEPSAFASTEFSSRRHDSTDRALLAPERIALGESSLCGKRETQAHLRHHLDSVEAIPRDVERTEPAFRADTSVVDLECDPPEAEETEWDCEAGKSHGEPAKRRRNNRRTASWRRQQPRESHQGGDEEEDSTGYFPLPGRVTERDKRASNGWSGRGLSLDSSLPPLMEPVDGVTEPEREGQNEKCGES